MPGQPLQTTAFILTRQLSGSDKFEQLNVFSVEHGVLPCLRRVATGQAKIISTPLDLFDEAELWLESSNQGRTWFIKEHRFIERHPGVGRSYEALRTASTFAALLARNPVSEESREAVITLLHSCLGALASGGRPDIVWLKTLYCFLRDEGYPVKQQWWPRLSGSDRDAAAQLLNQPLAAQNAEPDLVAHITRQLEDWLRAETEIRL
ncbi:hypothetical protein [Oleiharenicola lentus]|uniref:hypothetical protein n=1 Tax=Oleiharenicola lentus TaxID=2508720 RepID=UPI003F66FEEC